MLTLGLLACGGGADERSAEMEGEELPGAEAMTEGDAGGAMGSETPEMAVEERAAAAEGTGMAQDEESESAGRAAEAGRPGAVAPAPDQEAEMPKRLKNWMMLEFRDSVTEADLTWLASVGFRVDTVMSDRMVRGWLEKLESAEKLSGDERIVRIHAQMR